MDNEATTTRSFWTTTAGRMTVTALLLAVGCALWWLPAPGLRIDSAGYWGLPTHPLSLGAMGLAPFIAGYLVVECAAAVAPRWRPLRNSGREGRQVLHRAAGFVGLGIAAAMAVAVGVYWYDVVAPAFGAGALGLEGGIWERVVLGASLVGGASAFYLLASLITRYGLGNGFSVLIAGGLAWEMIPASQKFMDWIRSMNAQNLDVFGVLGNSLAVALVILGTLWMLLRAPRRTGARSSERDDGELGETAWWPLPGPTAGILPLAAAVWIVDVGRRLVARYSTVGPEGWMVGVRETVLTSSLGYMLVKAGIVVVGAYLFSRWFYRLEPTSRVWSEAAGVSRETVRADLKRRRRLGMLYSTGFLVGVLLLGAYGGELIGALGAVRLVILTAVITDLMCEWRFRRSHDAVASVEEVHRVGALPATLGRLSRRGIDTLARGQCHRALFHVFAPYVPIEILVPGGRRRAARDALAPEDSQ